MYINKMHTADFWGHVWRCVCKNQVVVPVRTILTSGSSAGPAQGGSCCTELEGGGGGDSREDVPGRGKCCLCLGNTMWGVRKGGCCLDTLGLMSSSAAVEGFEAVGAGGSRPDGERSGTVLSSTSTNPSSGSSSSSAGSTVLASALSGSKLGSSKILPVWEKRYSTPINAPKTQWPILNCNRIYIFNQG